MSITALNPVLAAIMTATRRPEKAVAPAPPDEAVKAQDGNLTGSRSGALSSKTQASLLSAQEDVPTVSIETLRKRMFEAYDTDQNGTIGETEWQHVADIGKTAIGEGAQPLDFRAYDPAAVSHQVYPSSLTILPFDGSQPSPETPSTSGEAA